MLVLVTCIFTGSSSITVISKIWLCSFQKTSSFVFFVNCCLLCFEKLLIHIILRASSTMFFCRILSNILVCSKSLTTRIFKGPYSSYPSMGNMSKDDIIFFFWLVYSFSSIQAQRTTSRPITIGVRFKRHGRK